MKTIAIIGTIGAGKSTVREIFDHHSGVNTRTIDLDVIAKGLRHSNIVLKRSLYKAFGNVMTNLDQETRQEFMLDCVFRDDELYQKLTNVYEPFWYAYITEAKELAEKDGIEILVIEGAGLIHSAELLAIFDHIVWVEADLSACVERVRARHRYTDNQISILMYRTNPNKPCPSVNMRDGVIHVSTTTESAPLESVSSNRLTKISTTDLKPAEIQDRVYMLCNELMTPEFSPQIKVAIYPGSFNPLHKGHIAVIRQILRTFDYVVLLRCTNGGKNVTETFPIDESKLPIGCKLVNWDGSFVQYLDKHASVGDIAIIRGLRNATDLQYEQDYVKHLTNMYSYEYDKDLPPVLYVVIDTKYQHISSSAIRAILPFEPEYAKSLMA